MKKFTLATTFILCLFVFQVNYCSGQMNKKIIQYFPKSFHTVKVDVDNSNEYELTPNYPFDHKEKPSEIKINIPHKIIFRPDRIDFKPVIPICASLNISFYRVLKFGDVYNSEGNPVLHNMVKLYIKKITDKEWYYGELYDDDYYDDLDDEEYYKKHALWKKRVEEAQKYDLKEPDTSDVTSALNFNLLEFTRISLISGIYEIYISTAGLKSNHAKVEIVFEK